MGGCRIVRAARETCNRPGERVCYMAAVNMADAGSRSYIGVHRGWTLAAYDRAEVGNSSEEPVLGRNAMHTRGRSWWVLTATAALLIGCCAGLTHLALRPTNGILVEQLETAINRELPLGSSQDQVELWLASQQLESWPISDDSGRKCGIGATIPNSSWLQSALIDIEFHFDRDGRLSKVFIGRYIYGVHLGNLVR